ncbi:MAG: hypothetical protein J6Y04_05225 [Bacteroidaceae bacterium]|nr:hypothetical protein [Bacteroidaceae bacterium]
MMFHAAVLIPIFAVVLGLSIPIVAIISGIVSQVKKNNNDREIRRLIIENHVDKETAKYLVEEPEKKQGSNPYPALRWGSVLIGLGLGALLNFVLNLNPKHDIYFWILLAFGCGLGLLCSFIIEYKLQGRAKREQANETE